MLISTTKSAIVTKNWNQLRIENFNTTDPIGLFLIFSIFVISGPVIYGPEPNSNPKSAPKTIPFFGLCPKPIPR